MAEKSTKRVREWTMKNPERRKEQNSKAAMKYYEKNKEDPDFMERKREATRKAVKKAYYKKRDNMTEEELAAEREKLRLKMKAYREKKKAEKLALEAAAKAQEGKTE